MNAYHIGILDVDEGDVGVQLDEYTCAPLCARATRARRVQHLYDEQQFTTSELEQQVVRAEHVVYSCRIVYVSDADVYRLLTKNARTPDVIEAKVRMLAHLTALLALPVDDTATTTRYDLSM